jgi:hypothetical protein
MEFGTAIPLAIMTVCCIGIIPIIGSILLAIVRFSFKDKQLTKNILFTVIGVGLASFIFPILQLAWVFIIVPQNCDCETSLVITPEIITEMFLLLVQYGTVLIFPGIALGFIFAFCVTLPITLVVRYLARRRPHAPNTGSK